MNIYARKGDKAVGNFVNGKIINGYSHDKEIANKHLKEGIVYTVERTYVDEWHTDVYLKEFPDVPFNVVCLLDYDPISSNIPDLDHPSEATPLGDYMNAMLDEIETTTGRVKIVCYCGSLRVAMDAFKKAEYESVLRGEIALLPCCMFVDIEREYGSESDYKQKADLLHKRKIDLCDEVFVLNVGGYVGQSTRSEIEYAYSIGKKVLYLEPITQQQ